MDGLSQIGIHQHALAAFLEEHDIRDIFVEGQAENYSMGARWWVEEAADTYKTYFKDGLSTAWHDLRPKQRLILGFVGGGHLYAQMRPGHVRLHPTTSQYEEFTSFITLYDLEQKRLTASVKKNSQIDRQRNDLIFTQREHRAAGLVMDFLATRPATTVALIYGAAHSFDESVFRRVLGPTKNCLLFTLWRGLHPKLALLISAALMIPYTNNN